MWLVREADHIECTMSSDPNRRFILIDSKSFDIVCEGKTLEGLRICENREGLQSNYFNGQGGCQMVS